MAEHRVPAEILGPGSGRVLLRIAEAVRDAAPFVLVDVVQFDGDVHGVLMQVGPSQHLVLVRTGGRWMCRDIYLDAETRELDTDPLSRRLMRESYRPLPVTDPRDLPQVAHRFLKRAITGWKVIVEHEYAQDHERRFAADALAKHAAASPATE
jgi:hypothetical protein